MQRSPVVTRRPHSFTVLCFFFSLFLVPLLCPFSFLQYTKAQRLLKYIDEIRKNYKREMKSEHSQFRQRATAIYLIDYLALRVGNEKDASEVADTGQTERKTRRGEGEAKDKWSERNAGSR